VEEAAVAGDQERRAEGERQFERLFGSHASAVPTWQFEEFRSHWLDLWFGSIFDPEQTDQYIARLDAERRQAPTQDFGDWLRQEIERRGWSQSELARRIETHPSLVSKWIRGLQKPQPRQCEKLAAAFGINRNFIMRAAGHVGQDWDSTWLINPLTTYLWESPTRQEAYQLLLDIPEPLIIALMPWLKSLADPNIRESTLTELKESLLHGPKTAGRSLSSARDTRKEHSK
jgi:transcriptional regulator with XRE-family HTH domain